MNNKSYQTERQYRRNHSQFPVPHQQIKPSEICFKSILTSYISSKKERRVKIISTLFLIGTPPILVRETSFLEGYPNILAANLCGELARSKTIMLLVYKTDDYVEQLTQQDGIDLLSKIAKGITPTKRIEMMQLYNAYASWTVIKVSLKSKSLDFYEISYNIGKVKEKTDMKSAVFSISLRKRIKDGCKDIIENTNVKLCCYIETIDITYLSNKAHELYLLNVENCMGTKCSPSFHKKDQIQIIEKDIPTLKIRESSRRERSSLRSQICSFEKEKTATIDKSQTTDKRFSQLYSTNYSTNFLEQGTLTCRNDKNIVICIPKIHMSSIEIKDPLRDEAKITITRSPRYPPLMYSQNKSLNKKLESLLNVKTPKGRKY
jgi:hypothetical protein